MMFAYHANDASLLAHLRKRGAVRGSTPFWQFRVFDSPLLLDQSQARHSESRRLSPRRKPQDFATAL